MKNELINELKRNLLNLRTKDGLFIASPSEEYSKIWLRDSIYCALAFYYLGDKDIVEHHNQGIFNILDKIRYKIEWAIKEKPKNNYQYIHARYNPETLNEYSEPWGNCQNDTIALLIAWLNKFKSERSLFYTDLLKKYLIAIDATTSPDNGMWEEDIKLNISSYLTSRFVLLQGNNQESLQINDFSNTIKDTDIDMSLLSLIFPFNMLERKDALNLLNIIESKLVREKGLIRYEKDKYNFREYEAEWTMGFPWLSIAYFYTNNIEKYYYYLAKSISVLTKEKYMPELYFGKTNQYNQNTPLGWSMALLLIALSLSNEKKICNEPDKSLSCQSSNLKIDNKRKISNILDSKINELYGYENQFNSYESKNISLEFPISKSNTVIQNNYLANSQEKSLVCMVPTVFNDNLYIFSFLKKKNKETNESAILFNISKNGILKDKKDKLEKNKAFSLGKVLTGFSIGAISFLSIIGLASLFLSKIVLFFIFCSFIFIGVQYSISRFKKLIKSEERIDE